MSAALEVMPVVGVEPILDALGLSRATFYRRRRPARVPMRPRPTPTRALSEEDRRKVLETLHSARFADKAPAEVVATLADEGSFPCSERTMYRFLEQNQETRERRNQLRHPAYARPELVATAPNQVWSWDITKLKTHVKWAYLHLYVLLDIFSRYTVGWMLANHENAGYAQRLISETCERQGVNPHQLVLHSDRGSPMRSGTITQLLARLDVTPSFSRPHVSNDNPFSESQFRTLKYSPGFPHRFGGLDDGVHHCESFFRWYNHDHHHSGIAFLTPSQVHNGQAEAALARRHAAKMAAWSAHPERFVNGPPAPEKLPPAVYINPPLKLEGAAIPATAPSMNDTIFTGSLSQDA